VNGLPPMLAENSLFKGIGQIFHPLFELVATVLAFIYGLVPNYAIAIILLTILIMALLTPLTIKSTKSMLAMQALQPELQKLRQKYKGAENREQLNQEMMRLYRENGVSPTGGCLPMFLQMPALIVLYDVIKGLANTIKKGTIYPKGTVLPDGSVAGAHTKCVPLAHYTTCAVPRYIPTSSKMYHDLIATPGVMKAFGLNLASKPLEHRANWWDYIPYFALVGVAVALQYFQMSQMTKRNKAAAQINPQMQTMQKVMPLIFAYIYFLVPAGVVLYMIVSSAIRVLTQDLIFRYGLVQRPGEREIGGETKRPPPGKAGGGAGPPEVAAEPGQAASGEGATKPGSAKSGSSAGKGGQTNGSRAATSGKAGSNGNTAGANAPKPHPRSKSKRARKAR
jgi:YidC/Oxa1 family membrane protein insertase